MAVFQGILDNNERSNQNHGFPLIEKSTEWLLKADVSRFNVTVHLLSTWSQYTS